MKPGMRLKRIDIWHRKIINIIYHHILNSDVTIDAVTV
jgi:hypothetical protein